jgi:hypothetical protein
LLFLIYGRNYIYFKPLCQVFSKIDLNQFSENTWLYR